ncbi:MAG TPA: sugar phosphate isomerase/epimerase [Pyrinomonadaceae bacterium]|nr:sugar phosphate isomerase/epimerase [Pyrinomonadaceae bacterium]
MSSSWSRRRFLAGVGAGTFATALSRPAITGALSGAILSSKQKIQFGYASITWDGNDTQAIKDISALGFRGIQLRSNILKDFGEKPEALRALLQQHKLEMVALSSGGVRIDVTEADETAKHVSNAKFVKAVGGRYLQVTDSARPKGRKPEASDFGKLGRVLTEIGKRASDLGVPVGYHNHMSSLGESPDEVERIMDAADPRFIKLELDIAHFQQGGGDPVRAIRQYRDRLLFLHIKDVEDLPATDTRGRAYRFVELGRGRVNLPDVFQALKEVGFGGWAVIELDAVPDKSRTPKECAEISVKYVEEKLNLRVR